MPKVKFKIKGQLVDVHTNLPLGKYRVITETGIGDWHSPLCMLGIGPPAYTDTEGIFVSTFFTLKFSKPKEIEIHIKIKPGNWRCRVVTIEDNMIHLLDKFNVTIDLDRVEIDFDKCRMPTGV